MMTVREFMLYAQEHDALDYNIIIYDEETGNIDVPLEGGACWFETPLKEVWLG